MYTKEDWADFIAAKNSGGLVEIDQEIFDYFLEVLPPIHMSYRATLSNGLTVHASFGFAEGHETVTAFWHGTGLQKGKYYCQQTKEINTRPTLDTPEVVPG